MRRLIETDTPYVNSFRRCSALWIVLEKRVQAFQGLWEVLMIKVNLGSPEDEGRDQFLGIKEAHGPVMFFSVCIESHQGGGPFHLESISERLVIMG
jgi:hypothetical protein